MPRADSSNRETLGMADRACQHVGREPPNAKDTAHRDPDSQLTRAAVKRRVRFSAVEFWQRGAPQKAQPMHAQVLLVSF